MQEKIKTIRLSVLVLAVMVLASVNLWFVHGYSGQHWLPFFVYLGATLLSSGLKVAMPKSDGTMSVNFIFIFLGILQLSPLQAVALAACSVLALCRFKVIKPFTIVQILFNLANVTSATILAWRTNQIFIAGHVRPAPALAVAALVYFFANSIPVALAIAWDSGTSPVMQFRQNLLWYLPFYAVGAGLAITAHFVEIAYGLETSLLLIPTAYTVYRFYRTQTEAIRDRERHIQETKALHMRTIEGLAMAIEAKDENTHGHLFRVRVYVSEIAKFINADESLMQALLTASYLHDIGKLAVPEHIINKPGKLTPEEFEKMKIHPIVGADILERVRFPYPVVPIVRGHHEAWDGSGYPDGLKGEQIPIGARILSVVDCFDALASERPYRRALPLNEAMAFVKTKAGAQFDPQIVALLEEHYVELESLVRQQTDEIEPLNTELKVTRGAAPGAGFEQVHSETESSTTRDSDQSATTVPHRDSLSRIAEAGQESKAILELCSALGTSLCSRETCSMMSQRLQPLIPFGAFAVYLKDCDALRIHYIDGVLSGSFTHLPIADGEGLSGWVLKNKRAIVNGNPTVEPNHRSETSPLDGSCSALSNPLVLSDGSSFGVLSLYSRRSNAFSKEHLRILQALEPKFSLSIQNALHFGSADTNSKFDLVTQLPNMRFFLRRVEEEIEGATNTSRFAVALCDLNSFKAVNDVYGHLTGNQFLASVASGFLENCRPGDMVARMGGDEFIFLLKAGELSEMEAHLASISRTFQIVCRELQIEVAVSASVGIAMYPDDGNTAEDLLGAADRRMYFQKERFYHNLKRRETQPALLR